MEKKRQANFELLRIIAMAMVVALHFFSKGGLLRDFSEPFAAADYGVWLAEAFCTVAVDVYVLIGGYFLLEAGFRSGKLIGLWGQILVYSLGVPAVCLLTGVLTVGELSLDRCLTWLFPVLREHYWFATGYLLLYLLSPLLGRAVKELEQRQLRRILALLLLLTCVSKSILPVNLAIDTGGYDLLWFICLYLIGAYFRKYGIPRPLAGRRGGLLYLTVAAAIFLLAMAYRQIYLSSGKLGDFYTGPYQYNHVLCLLCAVALFGAFSGLSIRGGRIQNVIRRIGACTFAVYLLHENEALRRLWPGWFGAAPGMGGLQTLLSLSCAVLFWFAAAVLVDSLRRALFRAVAGATSRRSNAASERHENTDDTGGKRCV